MRHFSCLQCPRWVWRPMRDVATLADKGNGIYEGPLQLKPAVRGRSQSRSSAAARPSLRNN